MPAAASVGRRPYSWPGKEPQSWQASTGPVMPRRWRRRQRDSPAKLAGVQIDVTRDEDAQRLIGTAVERFGGLNILVNNAGIVISGTVAEATDEDLQRLVGRESQRCVSML